MDENLHNIEDLFRSSLDDNEDEVPSKNVWDAVDKRLDKDNIISIKRKYTGIKRIAILLLLLLTVALYQLNTSNKNNRLAKNKSTDAKGKNLLDKKTGRALNDQNQSDSSLANGTTNTNFKPNSTVNNSVANNNIKSKNRQPVNETSRRTSQKQISNELINSGKDISKSQGLQKKPANKIIATGPAYQIKNINAKPSENEQPLVQNNDGNNILYSLKKPEKVSIETIAIQSIKSGDIKRIDQSFASAKLNVNNSIDKTLKKIVLKKLKSKAHFSLTPFLSPDIAWYRLKDDKIGNQQENASEIEKEEKHEFSSTIGALVDYKINKHWGLQSGFTFSNTNITVQPKTIYAQADNSGSVKYRINTSSGFGYVLPAYITNPATGDSLYAFTSTHSLHYIGIPLAVTYSIIKGKFNLKAVAGVATNILTRAKLETSVENGIDNSIETVNSLQGLKKVYFSGLAGIGVDYKLGNKTALTFAPFGLFDLNSINKDATVKSYPMSLGFAVGLKIGL